MDCTQRPLPLRWSDVDYVKPSKTEILVSGLQSGAVKWISYYHIPVRSGGIAELMKTAMRIQCDSRSATDRICLCVDAQWSRARWIDEVRIPAVPTCTMCIACGDLRTWFTEEYSMVNAPRIAKVNWRLGLLICWCKEKDTPRRFTTGSLRSFRRRLSMYNDIWYRGKVGYMKEYQWSGPTMESH